MLDRPGVELTIVWRPLGGAPDSFTAEAINRSRARHRGVHGGAAAVFDGTAPADVGLQVFGGPDGDIAGAADLHRDGFGAQIAGLILAGTAEVNSPEPPNWTRLKAPTFRDSLLRSPEPRITLKPQASSVMA